MIREGRAREDEHLDDEEDHMRAVLISNRNASGGSTLGPTTYLPSSSGQ